MRHLYVLLFFLPLPLLAQLQQELTGLARTQVQYLVDNSRDIAEGETPETTVLLREPGTSLPQQLSRLRQQLVNLPVFTRADWTIDTVGSDTIVRWSFEESRTIFPLFNFGGIEGNTYYQLGFTDMHFRGRGQQLTAYYQNNDGEHNYFLALTNPAFKGSRWGYALESQRYAAIEPLFFADGGVTYRYSNLSFGVGGSYTFEPRHHVSVGVSTFNERYTKLPDQEGTPGPDRANLQKFLVKTRHTLDRLDYLNERVSGTHHQTTGQMVLTAGERSPFLIAWHDYRLYRLIGRRGNLAARLRVGLSSNNDSPFAPFVLDSQVNIRGSGNRIDRGTAQLILNLEYRHSIIRDKKERFAIQLVAFSDSGTWRKPGGEISDLLDEENIRHFIGGGIRLLSLKAHNAVVRLDYGFDRRNKKERGLVAGFGQYF